MAREHIIVTFIDQHSAQECVHVGVRHHGFDRRSHEHQHNEQQGDTALCGLRVELPSIHPYVIRVFVDNPDDDCENDGYAHENPLFSLLHCIFILANQLNSHQISQQPIAED